MKVLSTASFKTIKDTQPGEIVALGRRSRMLGIVLKDHQNNGRLVGELTDTEEPHPRVVYASPNDECLSYGSDWVIEPVAGERAYPTLHEERRLSGVLALTKDGWFMSFATSGIDSQGRYNIEWWRLEDFVVVKELGSAALFNAWAIWPTEEAWADDRDELWEYSAKPPARHD